MATENSYTKLTFEDAMFAFFALLLAAQAMDRLPTLVQERLGIDIGAPYLSASVALSGDTPLGTEVNTPNGTPYYGSAGAEEAVGEYPPGTALTLLEGPQSMFGNVRWWYVEDDSDTAGWVPETALVKEGANGISEGTALGSGARAMLNTAVWRVAGGIDKIADVAKGEPGTLTDGPTTKNGSRWWYFDRANSEEDGWMPESALAPTTGAAWGDGDAVRTTRDTDMYERAGGGRTVGTLALGDGARVVGGPVLMGGAYWWLVRDEDGTEGWVAEDALEAGGVRGWFGGVIAVVLIVGAVFTILLLGGIVYATMRTNQIRAKEARRIREAMPKTMEPKRNDRWDKVLEHVSSENPNDWRLAIIEADVILDEMVTRMGYIGQTLGDKLKQITRGDVRTIDAAWEAHRVRNQIAHAGSDFILTQREARRVIELYGAVFEEFKAL